MSLGRALVPYGRAGTPAIDDACSTGRTMATGPASVCGVSGTNAGNDGEKSRDQIGSHTVLLLLPLATPGRSLKFHRTPRPARNGPRQVLSPQPSCESCQALPVALFDRSPPLLHDCFAMISRMPCRALGKSFGSSFLRSQAIRASRIRRSGRRWGWIGYYEIGQKTRTAVGLASPRSSFGRALTNGVHDGQRSSLICPSPISPVPRPSRHGTKDTGSSEPNQQGHPS
jgi:hypothetical protein